jgi:hypothetical protein
LGSSGGTGVMDFEVVSCSFICLFRFLCFRID